MARAAMMARRGVAPAASVGAFSPSDIPDIELWLRGASLSGSVGDRVDTWLDESGHGRHATQTVGAAKPEIALNRFGSGLGVRFRLVEFAFSYLNLPNFLTGFTEGEVFLIFKRDNDPALDHERSGLWSLGAVSGQNVHIPWIDGNVYESFGSTARKSAGDPPFSLSSDYRIYNLSSKAGEWIARLDGGLFYTTATNDVDWTTTPSLGGMVASAIWLEGCIDEMVLFSRVLTSDERASMHSYFADQA